MEINELTNEQLITHYTGLLKEIETHYKQKKDFEEEFKRRFNEKIEKKG